VDGGHGGGAAGDRFALTVFFDPAQAPLNHAIFGPRPTFTGELVAGEISTAAPTLRPRQRRRRAAHLACTSWPDARPGSHAGCRRVRLPPRAGRAARRGM
jgi:hypothetical protein